MPAKPQPAGSWSGDGVPSPVIVKIPIVLRGGGHPRPLYRTLSCILLPLAWPLLPTPALDSGPPSISWAMRQMLPHRG